MGDYFSSLPYETQFKPPVWVTPPWFCWKLCHKHPSDCTLFVECVTSKPVRTSSFWWPAWHTTHTWYQGTGKCERVSAFSTCANSQKAERHLRFYCIIKLHRQNNFWSWKEIRRSAAGNWGLERWTGSAEATQLSRGKWDWSPGLLLASPGPDVGSLVFLDSYKVLRN